MNSEKLLLKSTKSIERRAKIISEKDLPKLMDIDEDNL